MTPKTNGSAQRAQKLKHIQGDGPNWVLIAGGALLSTISIRLGCMLKQAFMEKRSDNDNNAVKGNGKSAAKRRTGACKLPSNLYSFSQDEDICCLCLSEIKRPPTSPFSKDGDVSLPLVKIPAVESNKESCGAVWAPSPDGLELAQKPFHHSNCSDSSCVSESGSDIYNKREVIQKLRQQLKKRDDMIMEMQNQIMDLQNSLGGQMTHSAHLQSQLDSANGDLFDSEREIQRLRKAIADHCMEVAASPKKLVATKAWRPEAMNGRANGFLDSPDDMEVSCWCDVKEGGVRTTSTY